MSPGSVRPRGCRDASVCRDASGELTASTAAANALNTRAGGFDWQPLTGRRCRPSTAGLEAKEASSARARRQQSAPSTAAPHDPRHVLGAGRLPRPRPGCIATSYLFSCCQPPRRTLALLLAQSAHLCMLSAQAPGADLTLVGTPKRKAEFGLRRSTPSQLSAQARRCGLEISAPRFREPAAEAAQS